MGYCNQKAIGREQRIKPPARSTYLCCGAYFFSSLLQFVLGALASPLVGIAGVHTALPMASVICFLGLAALLSFLLLGQRKPVNAASSLAAEVEHLEGH